MSGIIGQAVGEASEARSKLAILSSKEELQNQLASYGPMIVVLSTAIIPLYHVIVRSSAQVNYNTNVNHLPSVSMIPQAWGLLRL